MIQVEERTRRAERPVAPPMRVEPSPARDWTWVAFAVLTLVAFGLRMWELAPRAMHHDESLHALYSWYLYQGRGYTHDPMMHGPFLFHVTAFIYLLFGDSEVTARLPLVLFGTAAVFLPYFLRHELGRWGAFAVSLMLAFGPAFLYFSRFGHNEAFLVFQTLLLVVGLFGWVRTRRPVYLYTAAVAIGLMFATKIIALILGFIFATFIVVALAVEQLRGRETPVRDAILDIGWRTLGICAAIFAGIAVVLYTTFFTNLEGLCTMLWAPNLGNCAGKQGMLQYWIAQQGVARGNQPWFYYLLLIPLYEVVPLVLGAAAPVLARRPRTLFFWFCAWWALVSILLYSYASEKMPWLVVHPTLPLVVLGALTVDRVVEGLRRPWGLTPRQWAVVGLSLVALAAFVAWLGLFLDSSTTALQAQTATLRRVSLAVVLVVIAFGLVSTALKLSLRQALAAVGTAALGVLVLYSVHTAWQLTYKHGDIPVEMLVYVQSSPDAPFIAGEVERISNRLGLRKEMPLLLDGGYTETVDGQRVDHEAVSWPFEWYFRDYKAKRYFNRVFPEDFGTNRYPAILVMGTSLKPIEDQLGGYTGNKFRLNWWYPEDYKQITWSTVVDTLRDPAALTKVFKYVIYRELVNPVAGAARGLGAREMWFYVRNDLLQGTAAAPTLPTQPSTTIGAPAVPPADIGLQGATLLGRPGGQAALRDPKGIATDGQGRIYVADGSGHTITVLNADGSVARTWGREGNGDGQFKEPWGVAVAPDGSVFVADTWNHRVQKFDPEGRFLMKWGTGEISAEPGRFYGPRDIAITPAGDVLVADTGNKRIQVFSQDGVFRRTVGAEGTRPGQFREPVGVAVDRQGRIYVADTWNQRIQVFDASFEPLGQYAVRGWERQDITNKPYIAVTSAGDVYATVPESQQVVRLKDGQVAPVALPASPRLTRPTGVEIDPQGRLLVSDAGGRAVVAYELEPGSEISAPGP